MKKIFLTMYKVLLIVLILGGIGCSDEFLETKPTTDISDQDVYGSVEGTQTVLNGLYRWLREYNSGNTDRHEDMGQKSVDITLDVTDGRDIMVKQPAWYYFDADLNFDFTKANYSKVRGIWRFYYRIINNCNNIIANVDEATGDQSEKDRIKGEAYTLRAYAYFYLINMYQHSYIHGGNQPGVPIYTEPAKASDIGNPRGTVQNVYDQIIADLNLAVGLLPANGVRSSKSHVNINVANGILARTYLVMGQWLNAYNAAEAAKTGYPLSSQAQYVSGFNDNSNGEWLWGLPFNTEQQHYYYSFFSMFDLERSAGYFQMRMNNALYQSFSATDIRGKLAIGSGYPLVVYKNQAPINQSSFTTVADSLVMRKFRDAPDQTGHYVLMRSAEMILIQAECEYELSHFPEAKQLLFQIQSRADATVISVTPNNGTALLDEILYERRKELYGEGLASVLDLKRRNLPLVRTGNVYFTGSLPAKSNLLVWQIPQTEIDANDNISESDQNPL